MSRRLPHLWHLGWCGRLLGVGCPEDEARCLGWCSEHSCLRLFILSRLRGLRSTKPAEQVRLRCRRGVKEGCAGRLPGLLWSSILVLRSAKHVAEVRRRCVCRLSESSEGIALRCIWLCWLNVVEETRCNSRWLFGSLLGLSEAEFWCVGCWLCWLRRLLRLTETEFWCAVGCRLCCL